MWVAVDYGKKRTGFACSRSGGIAVSPCGVGVYPDGPWIKKKSFALVAEKLQIIFSGSDEEIEGVVLGDPGEDDDGSMYLRHTILELKLYIGSIFSCPVVLQDERFSSREVADAMPPKEQRAGRPMDDRAAAVILRRYLDSKVGP